jgi:diguanylate cyclase (GGDEF)-like protein
MDIKVHVADSKLLAESLTRRQPVKGLLEEVDLGAVLGEVLSWANRFVPSRSGSIFLDHPSARAPRGRSNRLYFAACFGEGSDSLAGTYIHADTGIAGETYTSGKSYISVDVREDSKFHRLIDRKIKHRTESIICAPIHIGETIVGVVELINRRNRKRYSRDDLTLLEIFAGYTAAFVENALAAREFEELSRIDDLTKLYNDRYFFLRLEGELGSAAATGGDVGLIFFDLDRFKEVNDTYGHLAGSEVLREVAALMRKALGKVPAVMARYGGDEYVIILPGMGLEKATAHAETIRAMIETNVFLGRRAGRGVPAHKIRGVVTCSMGVASFLASVPRGRTPSESAEALIRASDRAMYAAKDAGKNRVNCSSINAEP